MSFSDLDKVIRNLYKKGIRLFCYITPHLNIDGSIYLSNKDKDHFVKSKDGSDYVMDFGQFDTVTVDLTNPEAYNWYKGMCKFTFTYITKRMLAHPPNGCPPSRAVNYESTTMSNLKQLPFAFR